MMMVMMVMMDGGGDCGDDDADYDALFYNLFAFMFYTFSLSVVEMKNIEPKLKI